MNQLYYRDNYQQGAGIGRVYIGAPYQQGAGIGSFLGGVFRYVLPLLKRSAKAVGKEALQTGVNIMSDVGERKTPFKEAFKARVRQSGENLQQKAKEKLDKFMIGEGYKVRRSSMPRHLALALARSKKKKKKKKKKSSPKKGRRLRKKIAKKRKSRRRRKKQDFVDIFK